MLLMHMEQNFYVLLVRLQTVQCWRKMIFLAEASQVSAVRWVPQREIRPANVA